MARPRESALRVARGGAGGPSFVPPARVPWTRNVAELKPQQQREFSIVVAKGARVMQTTCSVSRSFESIASEGHGPFNALFDTGSSCCVITRRTAEACGLRRTGTVRKLHTMRQTGHPGTIESHTYLGDLHLPGGIAFMNVELLEGSTLPDIDVIVGLDVITCGDLSVNSSSGRSVFSFRTPAGRIAFQRTNPGPSESAAANLGVNP